MDDQPIQVSTQDTQTGAQHAPMTQDDHAAALGFITTLSQHLLSQDPEANPQDPNAQETGSQVNSSGAQAMNKDEEQDKEIQDIRDELQKLLTEEDKNGKKTEDTATAE